ncbi:hypothetical protein ACIQXR_03610 [Peribacillus sp. NPDC097224]|uniref:hypothetical protein n=1 Tax=unclassified Peribacillus TaxID=2675266 RepID=UPI0037FFA719
MKEAARQRDLAASFDGAAIFKGNVTFQSRISPVLMLALIHFHSHGLVLTPL